MEILFFCTAFIFCVATIVPVLVVERWYVRFFDFPRIQILSLGGVSVVAFAFTGEYEWYHIAVLLAVISAAVFQLYKIYPYTPLAPVQVISSDTEEDQGSIALVICNVYQYNRNSQKCIDSVRAADSDIILFVETDHWWDKQLSVFQETHPFRMRKPLMNTYGMILYSRIPLSKTEICHLIDKEVPSFHGFITIAGKDVEFWFVHPTPPIPPHNSTSLDRDAELMIVGKKVKAATQPVIVAGDLNDVAWSYTTTLFQKLSGLLDPRRGRGMYNTYNAKKVLLRWPLDHIFHSKEFKLSKLKRLPATGSDHYPMYVRLTLNPAATRKQESMETSGDDREVITRKIEKAT